MLASLLASAVSAHPRRCGAAPADHSPVPRREGAASPADARRRRRGRRHRRPRQGHLSVSASAHLSPRAPAALARSDPGHVAAGAARAPRPSAAPSSTRSSCSSPLYLGGGARRPPSQSARWPLATASQTLSGGGAAPRPSPRGRRPSPRRSRAPLRTGTAVAETLLSRLGRLCRSYGSVKWPFSPSKSVAGSAAFVASTAETEIEPPPVRRTKPRAVPSSKGGTPAQRSAWPA